MTSPVSVEEVVRIAKGLSDIARLRLLSVHPPGPLNKERLMSDKEILPVVQGDREAAASAYFAWISGNPVIPEKMRAGKVDDHSMIQAFARHRESTIEECARVCEAQAKDFLSEEYATPQPIGSVIERFACKECATAIRSLASPPSVEDKA